MKIDNTEHLTGIDDVELSAYPSIEGQEPDKDESASGNALWEYHTLGTINGVPVEESARKLTIDTEDVLLAAFTLDRTPKSMVFSISPEDRESVDEYDELMRRVSSGAAMLVDEAREFDAAKGRFIVWVRYADITYRLHPRFEYLKHE